MQLYPHPTLIGELSINQEVRRPARSDAGRLLLAGCWSLAYRPEHTELLTRATDCLTSAARLQKRLIAERLAAGMMEPGFNWLVSYIRLALLSHTTLMAKGMTRW